MLRYLVRITATLILSLPVSSPLWAEDVMVIAPVGAVTVYPRGAMMTREIKADLAEGQHRILLPYQSRNSYDGPPRITQAMGMTVGAVEILTGHVTDPVQVYSPAQRAAFEIMQKHQQEVDALADVFAQAQAAEQTAQAQVAFLKSLSGGSLQQVDATAVRGVTEAIGEDLSGAIKAAATARADLREEKKALEEAQKRLAQAVRDFEKTAPPQGDVDMLAVTVNVEKAGPVTAHLENLTYNARWWADYDLRLTRGETPKLDIGRKVVLSQNSGIAWESVDLTLSTENPFAQVNPSEPFPSKAKIGPKGKQGSNRIASTDRYQISAMGEDGSLESGDARAAFGGNVMAQTVVDGLSVSYTYPETVSVMPGDTELILSLDSFTFDARVFNRAAPRFDETAYLMAEFTNTTPEPFLPGAASVYRDGTFVGRSHIPLVPAGTQSEISFGPIYGIQLDYKLLDNETGDRGFLSSNNTRTQDMEFSVENLLNTSETVQTLFALPFSEQEDLKVSVKPHPQSDGVDFEQKRGVAEWKIELKPGEKKTVKIDVDMKWPDGNILYWEP